MAHGSDYFSKGSLKQKETKGTDNSSYSILDQMSIISFILPNNLIVYSLNAFVLFDFLFVCFKLPGWKITQRAYSDPELSPREA